MDCDLSSPIQYVKGVGPSRASLLSKINIISVKDVLYYQPLRYEARPALCSIKDVQIDMAQLVYGKIVSANILQPSKKRQNLKLFEIQATDGTGWIKAVWFNQAYLKNVLKIGSKVMLLGTVKRGYRGLLPEMTNPEFELIEEEEDITETSKQSSITAVYGLTEGLTQKRLRSIVMSVFDNCDVSMVDFIPQEILSRNNLPSLNESIRSVHFPPEGVSLEELNNGISPFQSRLAFDELFILQIGLSALKGRAESEKGIAMISKKGLQKQLINSVSFKLTQAQQRVIEEINSDMALEKPMNRLVQGDVGCGKTIVALAAMLNAIDSGYQAALMAPTELLAEQHYSNITRLLSSMEVTTALYTGSRKNKGLRFINLSEAMLIVGTHALIQEGITFERLGLAVIDEQHRFGVLQRASLRKKGTNPDVLIMTATPIPRTLALTLYGDLDYSVIDQMPPGRTPVITRLYFEKTKKEIFKILEEEIKKGRQAYLVYPLVEESENLDLRSAIEGADKLKNFMPEVSIGLIHGRMKQAEQEAIMRDFKEGRIQVLVSTTVIEVGVDVPNATVMIILHAERFGLAQLHQLRGRVGRGTHTSYCMMLCYGFSEDARKRLQVMVKTTDGFRIAEEDLRIRGYGDFFGTRQSGLPELKAANLLRDSRLLESARLEAQKLIESDPLLDLHPLLKTRAQQFWGQRLELFNTA